MPTSAAVSLSNASGLILATYFVNGQATTTTIVSGTGSFATVLEYIDSTNTRLIAKISVSDRIATVTFPSSQFTQTVTFHCLGTN